MIQMSNGANREPFEIKVANVRSILKHILGHALNLMDIDLFADLYLVFKGLPICNFFMKILYTMLCSSSCAGVSFVDTYFQAGERKNCIRIREVMF